MSRIRIPDHIQEIAKLIVVLNIEIAMESKLLEEEMVRINQRREHIASLTEKISVEEKHLLDECRDWVRDKNHH